jgi:hypothetical protein
MVSLNDLCNLTNPLDPRTASLRQACALPRSSADMRPLPEPHAEVAFDSSWEALFAGSDAMECGHE